jgi:hypothetical protein
MSPSWIQSTEGLLFQVDQFLGSRLDRQITLIVHEAAMVLVSEIAQFPRLTESSPWWAVLGPSDPGHRMAP